MYAPAFSSASWSFPEAPGIASESWFQFSVVNFPWPAVWVRTMPTLLNVSADPPATAFRFPAASASWSNPLTLLAASWEVIDWMSERS